MAAFVVITIAPNEALGKYISSIYPDMSMSVSPTVWLVADTNKTTKEVSEKINIKPEGFANAIVLKVDSYFGYAPPTIWEWLRVKGGGP